MGKDDATDIAEIQRIVEPWLGSVAWKAQVSYGSILPVEFGPEIVYSHRRDGRPITRGEWSLFIYCSSWRIETATEVLASSEDKQPRMNLGAAALLGRAIEAVEVGLPSLGTVFRFSGGVALIDFPIYSGEHPKDPASWELYTPDHMVLIIGPGPSWRYKPYVSPG